MRGLVLVPSDECVFAIVYDYCDVVESDIVDKKVV